jgi:K+-transporting ATPase ATPase A chain
MNTELLGIIATFLLTLVIAIPLGKYLAKVFAGEKVWTDFLKPFEDWIYKLSGINPKEQMNWKQHLKALLTINLLWLVYGFLVLIFQDKLPFNPDGNPGMTPDLAFNTIISFVANTNLQHYSGESGVSYLTQQFVLMFLQFMSAATGIAAAVVFFKAFRDKTTVALGNFWEFFVKAITRLLLPLSIVIALLLTFNGTPASYDGKDQFISMQGDTVNVSRGPAAQMIAIKHLGTNGGGYFGANSAHPFENPNYFTNMIEIVAQMLIPLAMVIAFGFFIRRRRMAWMIFGVMTMGTLLLLIPAISSELGGNPAIEKMGIAQGNGAMEGKEVRFGPTATAYWSIMTTVISTGSVNGMHDSTMPLTGMWQLLGMMINSFYGGCGVGLLNYFIYLIIAVFISGLMVGRTPEFLGHKVEAREIKMAAIITLLSPFLILTGTAIASFVFNNMGADWAVQPKNWLNNPGFHGFSEMLYEVTSSNANNGSGFEGLGDNNVFWNVLTGIIIFLGRFLPIIGPIAIAGLLAGKKFIPESAGTLRTDTKTFALMTFAVILVLNALSYFPALALGPLAEYFTMLK